MTTKIEHTPLDELIAERDRLQVKSYMGSITPHEANELTQIKEAIERIRRARQL